MTRDDLGSYPSVPEGPVDGAVVAPAETHEPAAAATRATGGGEPIAAPAPARRRSRAVLGAAFGVLAVFGVIAGAWIYASSTMPVPTPALVSLTPEVADKLLASVRLGAGRATYKVTRDFPVGRIISQSPSPYTRVAPGSRVNIEVAVAPKPATVPDVVGADSTYARSVLNYALFQPTVTYAYSTSARAGDVMEQLPRGGDAAVTGSADLLVISLGPGIPGSTVPAMIGKNYVQASREASDARLFVQPRPVIATGTPDGTIVDQAPTAGTVVPVGTNVWVSIADSRAAH